MIKLSEDILYNSELYEFIFFTLQLLDEATLYSKKEVLKEYENNKDKENLEELLLNKSIYPNGEKLGFYNISKYTLNDILNKEEFKLEEFFSDKKIFLEKLELFLEYFNGFNKEIQELFDLIPDLGPDLITSFATGKHITINESIAGDTGKFVYALRIDKHKEIISTVISDKRKVIELILVNIKNLLNIATQAILHKAVPRSLQIL